MKLKENHFPKRKGIIFSGLPNAQKIIFHLEVKKIIMKITQKGIEDLGFTFICRDEETGDDCSYNIPSNKIEGWYYLIVHHPSTNEIHISHHAIPLETTKDIHALENSVMTTMKELTEVLEKHKIISTETKIKNIKK